MIRRQSRELALQILFQTEFAPQIAVQDFLNIFEGSFDREGVKYANELVTGVKRDREKIDASIQGASAHWKLDRMATIDRNILRIAVFELHFSDENLAPNIIMNEAIEIAKKYGSEESSSFVNGVLNTIAKSRL